MSTRVTNGRIITVAVLAIAMAAASYGVDRFSINATLITGPNTCYSCGSSCSPITVEGNCFDYDGLYLSQNNCTTALNGGQCAALPPTSCYIRQYYDETGEEGSGCVPLTGRMMLEGTTSEGCISLWPEVDDVYATYEQCEADAGAPGALTSVSSYFCVFGCSGNTMYLELSTPLTHSVLFGTEAEGRYYDTLEACQSAPMCPNPSTERVERSYCTVAPFTEPTCMADIDYWGSIDAIPNEDFWSTDPRWFSPDDVEGTAAVRCAAECPALTVPSTCYSCADGCSGSVEKDFECSNYDGHYDSQEACETDIAIEGFQCAADYCWGPGAQTPFGDPTVAESCLMLVGRQTDGAPTNVSCAALFPELTHVYSSSLECYSAIANESIPIEYLPAYNCVDNCNVSGLKSYLAVASPIGYTDALGTSNGIADGYMFSTSELCTEAPECPYEYPASSSSSSASSAESSASSASSSVWSAPPTCNVVGYWPFNGNGTDLSGNGHTFTATATGVTFVPGFSGTGVRITDGYLTMDPVATMTGHQISFYWKGDVGGGSAWRDLLTHSTDWDKGPHISDENELTFYPPAHAGSVLNDGSWYHIAYLLGGGGNSASFPVVMRINGSTGSTTFINGITTNASSNQWIWSRLGVSQDGFGEFTNGTIDDLMITKANGAYQMSCITPDGNPPTATGSIGSSSSSSSTPSIACEYLASWSFDGTLEDETGNGHDFTEPDGTNNALYVTGEHGQALWFNSEGALDMENELNIPQAGSGHMVRMRVRLDDLSAMNPEDIDYRDLLSGPDGSHRFGPHITPGLNMAHQMGFPGGIETYSAHATDMEAGEWYELTYIYYPNGVIGMALDGDYTSAVGTIDIADDYFTWDRLGMSGETKFPADPQEDMRIDEIRIIEGTDMNCIASEEADLPDPVVPVNDGGLDAEYDPLFSAVGTTSTTFVAALTGYDNSEGTMCDPGDILYGDPPEELYGNIPACNTDTNPSATHTLCQSLCGDHHFIGQTAECFLGLYHQDSCPAAASSSSDGLAIFAEYAEPIYCCLHDIPLSEPARVCTAQPEGSCVYYADVVDADPIVGTEYDDPSICGVNCGFCGDGVTQPGEVADYGDANTEDPKAASVAHRTILRGPTAQSPVYDGTSMNIPVAVSNAEEVGPSPFGVPGDVPFSDEWLRELKESEIVHDGTQCRLSTCEELMRSDPTSNDLFYCYSMYQTPLLNDCPDPYLTQTNCIASDGTIIPKCAVPDENGLPTVKWDYVTNSCPFMSGRDQLGEEPDKWWNIDSIDPQEKRTFPVETESLRNTELRLEQGTIESTGTGRNLWLPVDADDVPSSTLPQAKDLENEEEDFFLGLRGEVVDPDPVVCRTYHQSCGADYDAPAEPDGEYDDCCAVVSDDGDPLVCSPQVPGSTLEGEFDIETDPDQDGIIAVDPSNYRCEWSPSGNNDGGGSGGGTGGGGDLEDDELDNSNRAAPPIVQNFTVGTSTNGGGGTQNIPCAIPGASSASSSFSAGGLSSGMSVSSSRGSAVSSAGSVISSRASSHSSAQSSRGPITFIDDGDPGFSHLNFGPSQRWNGAYNDDTARSFNPALNSDAGGFTITGTSSASAISQWAKWTFSDLEPGTYDVYVTWMPGWNGVYDLAGFAEYTVTSGGSSTVVASYNHAVSPRLENGLPIPHNTAYDYRRTEPDPIWPKPNDRWEVVARMVVTPGVPLEVTVRAGGSSLLWGGRGGTIFADVVAARKLRSAELSGSVSWWASLWSGFFAQTGGSGSSPCSSSAASSAVSSRSSVDVCPANACGIDNDGIPGADGPALCSLFGEVCVNLTENPCMVCRPPSSASRSSTNSVVAAATSSRSSSSSVSRRSSVSSSSSRRSYGSDASASDASDGNVSSSSSVLNPLLVECVTDAQCDVGPCFNGHCLHNVAVNPGFCGNSIVEAGESCDMGGENSNEPNASCRPDCSRGRCGDTIIDRPIETCDDGNVVAGDGCSALCQPESTQGNAPFDPLAQIPFQPGEGNTSSVVAPIDNVIRPRPPTAGEIEGDAGPATVAVMAAGAAAGYAWVRRKFRKA